MSVAPSKTPLRREATQFLVALDDIVNCDYNGIVQHVQSGDCWKYHGILDLLSVLQELVREQLPATHRERTWMRRLSRKERVIPMSDQRMEIKGEGATFLMHIQYRQNATWQGTLEWLEGKQKVAFRSTLELIRLMEQVVGDSAPETPAWSETEE